MLWHKRPPKPEPAGERGAIGPAEVPLAFDAGLFQRYFSELQKLAEADEGIEAYLAGLNAKQRLFADTLGPGRIQAIGLEQIEAVLDRVFTARRRIFPALEKMGETRTRAAVEDLLHGREPLAQRMQAFAGFLPAEPGDDRESIKAARKLGRAAFDFAAELLHFSDPVKYPLMTRWVWDQGTMSGALREFIAGSDQLADVPLGGSPEMFEGARQWFADRIAEAGIYRDVPFWIDLTLAQAYTTYLRSMAEGNLGGDFGRGAKPQEQLRKLLGIEAARKDGRSRVKRQDSASRIDD